MHYHYCVLYTQVLKQWEIYKAIKLALPEGRGTVFYPCVELWWNDTVDTVIKPLFPGYVFIRSDMGRAELHDIVMRRRRDILSFVKELRIAEMKKAEEQPSYDGDDDAALIDLQDDEAEFLDFMLNFRYKDNERTNTASTESEVGGNGDQKNPEGNHGKPVKLPEEGIFRMSRGYCEDGKYTVMEGPLRGFEDKIIDVDRRKREAYLKLQIHGHIAKAGLEILGKKHWFPKDEHASAVLGDGTEIDPMEIARRMMLGSEGEDR